MQLLHDFLRSDGLLVVQFCMTVGLLIFGLLLAAQLTSRQRKLVRENTDLKDEVNAMAERRDRAVKRLTDEQNRHRLLLSKIGDDIYDVQSLTPADFDCVRQIENSKQVTVSRDIDRQMVPMPSNDPRFNQENSHDEPAVVNTVGASVTDISAHHADLQGPIDDSLDNDSDPLTRALKISRAFGRD